MPVRLASTAPEPLLTVEDVASRLSVDPKTVRRLVQRGALRAIRVARLYRFDPAEIRDYLKRNGGQ